MKIQTKVLIGFLSIIVLVFVQMAVTHKLQSNILDNTRQIKDIEAPLEVMSEQVIGYDAMLTGNIHDALIHATEGEYDKIAEHRTKYEMIGIKLEDLLKRDARILLAQSKRPQAAKDTVNSYLKILDRDNIVLVDLEIRAFAAIEKKDTKTAYSLVMGGEYDIYKNELDQNYRAWADVEHEMALGLRKDILRDSQRIIYFNLGISIVIILLVIMIILIINSFISQLISRQNKEQQ